MKNISITLYHADWCGHCIRFLPIWEQLKKYISKNKLTDADGNQLNISLKSYEHTKNQTNTKDNKIIAEKNIESFPTIMIEDESGTREYAGPRDSPEQIMTFILAKSKDQNGGNYLNNVVALAHNNKDMHRYAKYKSKLFALRRS